MIMNLAYDMHLHSCLSPCGDDAMTPGNIVGMAYIKQLDVVALTDHNTCRNCPAFMKLADNYGLVGIPGMEITTAEDIHVLAYFPSLELALDFDKYVYGRLMKIKNKPKIFGMQQIMNENDEVIGEEENLLIQATDITFDEVYDVVKEHGGFAVPAHINKVANSLLGILGFMPPNHKFTTIEVSDKGTEIPEDLKNLIIIKDSDAHFLEHINEPINHIEVTQRSIKGVLRSIGFEC